MAKQSTRKGKKTITQRTFYDEVTVSLEGKEKQLQDLFGIFIKAKELEGLREHTLRNHNTHFRYFNTFLQDAYPEPNRGIDITTEIVRDYIYYMTKKKFLWDDHPSSSYKYIEKKGLSSTILSI